MADGRAGGRTSCAGKPAGPSAVLPSGEESGRCCNVLIQSSASPTGRLPPTLVRGILAAGVGTPDLRFIRLLVVPPRLHGMVSCGSCSRPGLHPVTVSHSAVTQTPGTRDFLTRGTRCPAPSGLILHCGRQSSHRFSGCSPAITRYAQPRPGERQPEFGQLRLLGTEPESGGAGVDLGPGIGTTSAHYA